MLHLWTREILLFNENFYIFLNRVCKPGGWLIDCPGDSVEDMSPSPELTSCGWEEIHYVGSYGKDVYIHRKQVVK